MNTTKADIERYTSEQLKALNSDLTVTSVTRLENDQDDLWDIRLGCLGCPDSDVSILTQGNLGNVASQIRQRIQEHMAKH